MIRMDLIAVGRLRRGPDFELCQEYLRRIRWPLSVFEVEAKGSDPAAVRRDEHRRIEEHLKDSAHLVVLDEKGKSLRSQDFAAHLRKVQDTGPGAVQFVIGGADGLGDDIRGRASLLLSFGQQTWPHMLARVMLLEQIYRAQQILNGHPYHRE